MAKKKIVETPKVNPKFAKYKVEVRPSKIHRWGVYALEDIAAKRRVMEYTGERISRRETKRRAEEQSSMIYLFTVDAYWCLDGAVGGSGAERVNHSCDPNIVAEVVKGRIYYRSRRAIAKEEELTIDYHFSKDIDKIPCKCGAATCRGTINLTA